MIKQISELKYGDLVFWENDRWIAREGEDSYRVLEHLDYRRRPQTLLTCHGPVSVFGFAASGHYIPF